MEEHWNITHYRATLGHKANHSFTKHNSQYISLIHPRHGPISAIMSLKRIAKGEEVLVFYGYSPNSFVSSWYAKAYEEELHMPWPGRLINDENDRNNIP